MGHLICGQIKLLITFQTAFNVLSKFNAMHKSVSVTWLKIAFISRKEKIKEFLKNKRRESFVKGPLDLVEIPME